MVLDSGFAAKLSLHSPPITKRVPGSLVMMMMITMDNKTDAIRVYIQETCWFYLDGTNKVEFSEMAWNVTPKNNSENPVSDPSNDDQI